MGVRERILTIRLLERLQAHPDQAQALGLQTVGVQTACTISVSAEKGLTAM